MKKGSFLLSLVCILAATYMLAEATKIKVKAPDYQEKIQAASLSDECFRAIHELKQQRGIPIDKVNDINDTGLIGLDYSDITTTLGSLEAKRTAANPNMAAVLIDMFNEIGLKAEDKVAVNCSGSFPSLNIAVLCAIQVKRLNSMVMSSFGSSTYGANDPKLTFLDMEDYLVRQGMLADRSDFFSIGGMGDMGKEMPTQVKEKIVDRIKSYGYTYFSDDDLLHNVSVRYRMYNDFGEIKCFINVGGNEVSFGNSNVIVHANGGILTQISEKDNSMGLVQLFLKDGIPVIHLLNIKKLASDYGMPIDPVRMPEIGDGAVYYEQKYNKVFAWIGLVAAAFMIWYNRVHPSIKDKGKR